MQEYVRGGEVRHIFILLVVTLALNGARQACAQAIDDQSPGLFFAGAYYDVPTAEGNFTTRYIVGPITQKASQFTGDELTAYVEQVMRSNPALASKAKIAYESDTQLGKNGNAVAVYIPRAQHDVIRYSFGRDGDKYLTIVSISIALDVFTDKAAEKNQLQLESLYSRLLVGVQPIRTAAPLTDTELAAAYVSLLNQTLQDVFNAAADDQLGRQRVRANAAFQLTDFFMPKALPPEIAQLIGNGGDAERQKLSLELLHLVNKTVSDELRSKGYQDIALLSPPTAWSMSNVGELLANRLVGKSRNGQVSISFYVDPAFEQGAELRIGGSMGVLGYQVKTALARVETRTLKQSEMMNYNRLGVQLQARVYRPQPGQAPKWMPVTIPEEARTARGVGGADFENVAGMDRGTNRELAMNAIRSSALELAPGIVALMKEISEKRIENR